MATPEKLQESPLKIAASPVVLLQPDEASPSLLPKPTSKITPSGSVVSSPLKSSIRKKRKKLRKRRTKGANLGRHAILRKQRSDRELQATFLLQNVLIKLRKGSSLVPTELSLLKALTCNAYLRERRYLRLNVTESEQQHIAALTQEAPSLNPDYLFTNRVYSQYLKELKQREARLQDFLNEGLEVLRSTCEAIEQRDETGRAKGLSESLMKALNDRGVIGNDVFNFADSPDGLHPRSEELIANEKLLRDILQIHGPAASPQTALDIEVDSLKESANQAAFMVYNQAVQDYYNNFPVYARWDAYQLESVRTARCLAAHMLDKNKVSIQDFEEVFTEVDREREKLWDEITKPLPTVSVADQEQAFYERAEKQPEFSETFDEEDTDADDSYESIAASTGGVVPDLGGEDRSSRRTARGRTQQQDPAPSRRTGPILSPRRQVNVMRETSAAFSSGLAPNPQERNDAAAMYRMQGVPTGSYGNSYDQLQRMQEHASNTAGSAVEHWSVLGMFQSNMLGRLMQALVESWRALFTWNVTYRGEVPGSGNRSGLSKNASKKERFRSVMSIVMGDPDGLGITEKLRELIKTKNYKTKDIVEVFLRERDANGTANMQRFMEAIEALSEEETIQKELEQYEAYSKKVAEDAVRGIDPGPSLPDPRQVHAAKLDIIRRYAALNDITTAEQEYAESGGVISGVLLQARRFFDSKFWSILVGIVVSISLSIYTRTIVAYNPLPSEQVSEQKKREIKKHFEVFTKVKSDLPEKDTASETIEAQRSYFEHKKRCNKEIASDRKKFFQHDGESDQPVAEAVRASCAVRAGINAKPIYVTKDQRENAANMFINSMNAKGQEYQSYITGSTQQSTDFNSGQVEVVSINAEDLVAATPIQRDGDKEDGVFFKIEARDVKSANVKGEIVTEPTITQQTATTSRRDGIAAFLEISEDQRQKIINDLETTVASKNTPLRTFAVDSVDQGTAKAPLTVKDMAILLWKEKPHADSAALSQKIKKNTPVSASSPGLLAGTETNTGTTADAAAPGVRTDIYSDSSSKGTPDLVMSVNVAQQMTLHMPSLEREPMQRAVEQLYDNTIKSSSEPSNAQISINQKRQVGKASKAVENLAGQIMVHAISEEADHAEVQLNVPRIVDTVKKLRNKNDPDSVEAAEVLLDTAELATVGQVFYNKESVATYSRLEQARMREKEILEELRNAQELLLKNRDSAIEKSLDLITEQKRSVDIEIKNLEDALTRENDAAKKNEEARQKAEKDAKDERETYKRTLGSAEARVRDWTRGAVSSTLDIPTKVADYVTGAGKGESFEEKRSHEDLLRSRAKRAQDIADYIYATIVSPIPGLVTAATSSWDMMKRAWTDPILSPNLSDGSENTTQSGTGAWIVRLFFVLSQVFRKLDVAMALCKTALGILSTFASTMGDILTNLHDWCCKKGKIEELAKWIIDSLPEGLLKTQKARDVSTRCASGLVTAVVTGLVGAALSFYSPKAGATVAKVGFTVGFGGLFAKAAAVILDNVSIIGANIISIAAMATFLFALIAAVAYVLLGIFGLTLTGLGWAILGFMLRTAIRQFIVKTVFTILSLFAQRLVNSPSVSFLALQSVETAGSLLGIGGSLVPVTGLCIGLTHKLLNWAGFNENDMRNLKRPAFIGLEILRKTILFGAGMILANYAANAASAFFDQIFIGLPSEIIAEVQPVIAPPTGSVLSVENVVSTTRFTLTHGIAQFKGALSILNDSFVNVIGMLPGAITNVLCYYFDYTIRFHKWFAELGASLVGKWIPSSIGYYAIMGIQAYITWIAVKMRLDIEKLKALGAVFSNTGFASVGILSDTLRGVIESLVGKTPEVTNAFNGGTGAAPGMRIDYTITPAYQRPAPTPGPILTSSTGANQAEAKINQLKADLKDLRRELATAEQNNRPAREIRDLKADIKDFISQLQKLGVYDV